MPQTLWKFGDVGHTQEAKEELLKYVDFDNTENILNSVKPSRLLMHAIRIGTNSDSNDVVLDFFAGSGPTGHAVLKLNSKDNGNRKFILVQIPEPLPVPEPKAQTIADLCRSRIRSISSELDELQEVEAKSVLGFRVLKIDSSNMADVFYTPDQTTQADLLSSVDNVKPDRTAEDLLFQVLLDWGVDLTLPIRRETVQGKTVFFVDDTALMACFDDGISEGLVKELAAHAPMRIVFKDTGFADDQTKINVKQIFKAMSPATEVKAI